MIFSRMVEDRVQDAGGVFAHLYGVRCRESRAMASQVPLKIPRKSRPGRWTVEAGETLVCRPRYALVPSGALGGASTVEK